MKTLVKILALILIIFAMGNVQAKVLPPLTLQDIKAGDYDTHLPTGDRLVRFWIDDPEAKCNDGTQPAIYVRPGEGDNQNNWLIYLQGGGSCGSGEDCLGRWTEHATYGIQKMSTGISEAVWKTWYPKEPVGKEGPDGWTLQGGFYQIPETIGGKGVFSAASHFADWSQVYAYYCSSDSWAGRNTDKEFDVSATPVGRYTINFQGATIFDKIVEELRTGSLQACYDLAREPFQVCVNMPDLDGADTVLLAGSSAGSNGVKNNLDRFRQRLTLPDNPQANPDMEVRGVFDAAGSPSSAGLPWPTSAFNGISTSYDQTHIDKWQNEYLDAWNARVDQSCLVENPGRLQYRCADTTHVLRHHITTPFFHRMDLLDSVGSSRYQQGFYRSPPYDTDVWAIQFSHDVSAQLKKIGHLASVFSPRYSNELDTISNDRDWLSPGVFGPRCENHMGLIYDEPFFEQYVPNVEDAHILQNYDETLWQWVNQTPMGINGPLGPVYIDKPSKTKNSNCSAHMAP